MRPLFRLWKLETGFPDVRLLARLLVLSALGGVALSCRGDNLDSPAPVSPTIAYWALQLNDHAVNLALVAPYDTVQLTATPFSLAGAPLTGLGPVTYYNINSTDTTVTVSPTGLVTAKVVETGAEIVASLQDVTQGVTQSDTVYINVTSDPPPLPLTFSLQPTHGDSAYDSYNTSNGYFGWPVTATDAGGDTLCVGPVKSVNGILGACALQVYYTSSNPHMNFNNRTGGFTGVSDSGTTVLTATTLAYGRVYTDSVVFTAGISNANLTVAITKDTVKYSEKVLYSSIKRFITSVGAIIAFENKTLQPVDVQFDQTTGFDTASVAVYEFGFLFLGYAPPTGIGDISAFGGVSTILTLSNGIQDTLFTATSDYAARRFTVPGVYHYHSSLFPSDTNEIDIVR